MQVMIKPKKRMICYIHSIPGSLILLLDASDTIEKIFYFFKIIELEMSHLSRWTNSRTSLAISPGK